MITHIFLLCLPEVSNLNGCGGLRSSQHIVHSVLPEGLHGTSERSLPLLHNLRKWEATGSFIISSQEVKTIILL